MGMPKAIRFHRDVITGMTKTICFHTHHTHTPDVVSMCGSLIHTAVAHPVTWSRGLEAQTKIQNNVRGNECVRAGVRARHVASVTDSGNRAMVYAHANYFRAMLTRM